VLISDLVGNVLQCALAKGIEAHERVLIDAQQARQAGLRGTGVLREQARRAWSARAPLLSEFVSTFNTALGFLCQELAESWPAIAPLSWAPEFVAWHSPRHPSQQHLSGVPPLSFNSSQALAAAQRTVRALRLRALDDWIPLPRPQQQRREDAEAHAATTESERRQSLDRYALQFARLAGLREAHIAMATSDFRRVLHMPAVRALDATPPWHLLAVNVFLHHLGESTAAHSHVWLPWSARVPDVPAWVALQPTILPQAESDALRKRKQHSSSSSASSAHSSDVAVPASAPPKRSRHVDMHAHDEANAASVAAPHTALRATGTATATHHLQPRSVHVTALWDERDSSTTTTTITTEGRASPATPPQLREPTHPQQSQPHHQPQCSTLSGDDDGHHYRYHSPVDGGMLMQVDQRPAESPQQQHQHQHQQLIACLQEYGVGEQQQKFVGNWQDEMDACSTFEKQLSRWISQG
jgi:hypothetical protein